EPRQTDGRKSRPAERSTPTQTIPGTTIEAKRSPPKPSNATADLPIGNRRQRTTILARKGASHPEPGMDNGRSMPGLPPILAAPCPPRQVRYGPDSASVKSLFSPV